jgi:NAD(P)-dependent dehydrogenase (short-subunit alcohol dehydrogenase family)
MTEQVCLVTGATSGMGAIVTEALVAQGATVVMVGRDKDRANAAADRIRARAGNPKLDLRLANLSRLADVRALGQAVVRSYPRLDTLVNNAGATFWSRETSADGIEMTFAVNYLSMFLLTNLLLDLLRASAPSRIVNVTSRRHAQARLDLSDIANPRTYSGTQAYARSKLCVLLFTYEMARRLDGTGVTVNAVHPGFVATHFAEHGLSPMSWMTKLAHGFAISPKRGADAIINLASSPELAGVSGRYFVGRQPARSSTTSYDAQFGRRLWALSEHMTGEKA